MRTSITIDKILSNGKKNKNFLKSLCGLPVSTYFSAVKLRWLFDHVEKVQEAVKQNRCMFGTVDTWLIWVISIITSFQNALQLVCLRI